MQKIFEEFYRLNHWYDEESRSGSGSNLKQTSEIRRILPEILTALQIKTILDIPCGDFNWMKEVDLKGAYYCGADIVVDVITHNTKNYLSADKRFNWADITSTRLGEFDLVFCRDCLVHLSDDDVKKAICNIKRSGSKYLMTTTFTNRINRAIETGGWRPINLEATPFLFSAPLEMYNENCTEEGGMYMDKSLAVWRITDLPDFTVR
jgi:2-polyprenyl-3-methyl-5-hydroxy-6-metoxy-1,4-benzoquinol methylase